MSKQEAKELTTNGLTFDPGEVEHMLNTMLATDPKIKMFYDLQQKLVSHVNESNTKQGN